MKLDVKEWIAKVSTELNDYKVLWTGAHFMTDAQTISLSENITAQKHGIVLVWSAYASGQAQNYDFVYHFVPKYHATQFAGSGVNFFLSSFNQAGNKYLYIGNGSIIGHAMNDDSYTGTGNKIGFNNSYWVLRAVLGV